MATVLALCFLLLSGALSVRAICPDRCDCQHAQHLLCTNRGLRAVPKASARSSGDVLVLSLGGNFIGNISAFDLSRFSQLTRLDLQYNQIQTVHPKAFEKLSRLEELYLGNNLLSAVIAGTLQPLKKLRILDANSNEIDKITPDTFMNLENLIKLRLDGNSIQTLQDSVFKGNEIQHVGNHVFQNLKSLTRLSLSNNNISLLEPEALEGLSSVRELLIDGNQLADVPARLLDPLKKLEELDLSRNQISQLHHTAFNRLMQLKVLKLNDNQLTSLAGNVFASNGGLYRLDLSANRWTCDCRLSGFKEWIRGAHFHGRLLAVFVRCLYPARLAGKYLDYLDSSELQPVGNHTCVSERPAGGAVAEGDVQADQGRPSLSEQGKRRKGVTPRVRPSSRTSGSLKRVRAGHPPTMATPTVQSAARPERLQQHRPLVAEACQFNTRFLLNVTVEQLSSSTASVRWELRPRRAPPYVRLQFRVRYDRFGAAAQFPRFVYLGGGARAVTLRELAPDRPYMVCVEGVVGGAVCEVASRDHCAGVVTQRALQGSGGLDLQLVTVATLAANALLLLVVGGAWAGRGLRRRLQRRKSAVNIRHMYSTRRPLRALATDAVSSDFTAYQSSRHRLGGADEGDLIQFPCDRFLDNSTARRDDAMRFQD
ncbi:hypothetical protein SKAU_G00407580 [Synaphobranchus kaupii]|uniref:LRRCT domain-containing protein n=1 Tax=Synaphobranchus kaupii TaxID=118154 RepID=A0A9Q1EAA3_SYNKA|nr:hypothetical protein SKAU_G00407580 [Synaphobranchus kaupii]